MIAIIDSGVANLTSVYAALSRLNAEAVITDDPKIISKADRVILPGVGSASAAMESLQKKGLIEPIRALTQPVLGICLGMQILFQDSEESADGLNKTPCLGILEGTVQKLRPDDNLPIPHMGWNDLINIKEGTALLDGVDNGSYVYFVHSFAVPVTETTVASANYGEIFTATCHLRNFWGCQFHPERSGKIGSTILTNFLKLGA